MGGVMRVYRRAGLPVEVEAVKGVVAAYFQEYRRMPRVVLVPVSVRDEAAAVLEGLQVHAEVKGLGGVLIPELWVAVGEEEPRGVASGAPEQSGAAKQLTLM